jgi:PAS domain S-box-containing protein
LEPAEGAELSQLRAVLEAVTDGVAVFDREGRFLFWNRRYARAHAVIGGQLRAGGSYEAFLRQGAEVGQFLDASARLEDWLAERVSPEASVHQEHLPGDRWVRVKTQPLDEGGCVRVVTETTGVRRTDTSFRLMFEANPIPMSVVDGKTLAFLAVNEAMTKVYGYSRREALAMTMLDLVPPDLRTATLAIMRSDLGSYQGQEVWTQMTADGRRISIRPYVGLITYEGRPCLFCAAVPAEAEAAISTG